MTVNTAIEQLLLIEDRRKEKVYGRDTLCVGLARVGTSTQTIVSGTMEELLHVDFGEPLHCFIICADDVHFMEKELLDYFHVGKK
jgi:diphthine synthase